jgi:hypothetical protein
MNFVTFNQDYSYLAVATSKGFRIFTTDPFAKSYETKEGNIAIIEMLFSTSLVALILSPRRLQITNTKVRSSSLDNCTFLNSLFPDRHEGQSHSVECVSAFRHMLTLSAWLFASYSANLRYAN